VGCLACNRTGYQGRTGIYEIVSVDDAMRGLDDPTSRPF